LIEQLDGNKEIHRAEVESQLIVSDSTARIKQTA